MRLQTKFTVYLTLSFLVMVALLLLISYWKARQEAEERAYEICDKLLSEVEATRAYVREVLEPLMMNLAGDRFIPEIMYTGYIARATTEIFTKQNPDYKMKFASLNPRNPVNAANELEEEIIRYFKANPDAVTRRVISRNNGLNYITVAIPYRFTKDCLVCHGSPEDAPPELIERYGDKNGFGVAEGDVTINSITTPIRITYSGVWNQAVSSLMPMLALSVVMFIITASLFNKLVALPVWNLKQGVESIAQGRYNIRVESDGSDEINDLAVAYNKMAEKLEENIIKRNKAEADLENVNKELEQIVYVASHDLRSPLVNVEGYHREIRYSLKELEEVLEMRIPPEISEKVSKIMDRDIPEAAGYIEKSLYKMDSLQNALLKLSRSGKGQLNIKDLDMNVMIKNIIDTTNFKIAECGATVSISELPSCKGDEGQINQLFSNLLSNAVKYLDHQRPGAISISGYRKEGESIYCVEDNGIGIKPEDQEKIFRVFQQIDSERDGEGLGLSIARKIAERHNGRIWVESEAGKGSRFYVALPA